MDENKEKVTVIVPCYNEDAALAYFYDEINKISNKMKYLDFEFLFIDDGSRDNTFAQIKNLSNSDNRVKYITFSRNFGKEAAIYAGLESAKGDYAVIMDADLQDPPSLLPELYNAVANEGYDSAATRRVTRKGEPIIRSFFAKCFYKIINKVSKTEVVDGARDYRFMNRKFVDALLNLGEYNRFSKGIFGWVGFDTKWIEFENVERVAGETKWSFWSLFKYSIEGIVAFTSAPLVIASFLGTIMCFAAFASIILIIIRKLFFGDPTSGWPSMACIVLLVGGIQLLCTGILGQYLAKVYLEVKKRPIYLVKEKNI